jgi:hypothetical protein
MRDGYVIHGESTYLNRGDSNLFWSNRRCPDEVTHIECRNLPSLTKFGRM